VEDGDVAGGNAEAVDVFEGVGGGGVGVLVGEAAEAAEVDGGVEVGGPHGVDVDGALAVGLLAEDGEVGLGFWGGGRGHGWGLVAAVGAVVG
jgi:hypothetical protein